MDVDPGSGPGTRDDAAMTQHDASRFGPNVWLIDEMYRRFQEDPSSVGEVWREIAALQESGLEPTDALAAASTVAREFLGEPALDEGAPADLVVYEQDPRNDPQVLARPALVMLGGEIIRRARA